MRRLALIALTAPALLAAASTPRVEPRATPGQLLAQAEREARSAGMRVRQLEARERGANDAAARLTIERQRAAAQIELAEARIAAADAALVQARAAVKLREDRLARRRASLAALLAGLATIGRRPPILTLADGATVTEVVRVRALVDATMPVIARRSAALQAELASGKQLAAAAAAARGRGAERRAELAARLAEFGALERSALARADTLRRESFVQQDQVMAGGEDLLDLRSEAQSAAAARAFARALVREPLATPRPFAGAGAAHRLQFRYRLPSAAPVVEGLGEVSAAGVRSRGIRLATPRGSTIAAPAAGTVLFAGAFRDHDGIVVIDHGGGWTSLLIGIAPSVRRGDRIALAAPIGRTLGELIVELRQAGQPRSPALIAGSSDLLSNVPKNR